MNERGSILTAVLLLLALVLLLGLPVLQLADATRKASVEEQMKTQAFYLAEAGLAHGQLAALTRLEELATQSGWDPHNLVGSTPFLEVTPELPLATGTYKARAWLSHLADDRYEVLVQARGIPNSGERLAQITTLRFPVTIRSGHGDAVLDMALFGGGGFKLTGSSTIDGHVVSNATIPGSIEITGTSSITGNLTLGPGANPEQVVALPSWRTLGTTVDGTVGALASPRFYPPVKMPATPSLPARAALFAGWNPGPPHFIDADGYYPEIIVKSELRIQVGGGKRHLRVGKLEISGSGRLVIEGSGKLVLYVDNEMTVANSGAFNSGGQPEQALIYYYGERDFTLTGSGTFRGTIQAEKANVRIGGSGSMWGHIITGGTAVDLTGSGTAQVSLIYAPNAAVQIANSASVEGAIVSDYCSITGSGLIEYDARVIEIYEQVVGEGNAVVIAEPGVWSPR